MPADRPVGRTAVALLAFAANSLLCRSALAETRIDAATFTAVRLAAGAGTLWLLVRVRRQHAPLGGDWPSALALFTYAAAFSFAYTSLTTATGALLLFGTVQLTMIGAALRSGECLGLRASSGVLIAASGVLVLLLPGLAAPPLAGALLMLGAGVAWGIYSLRGRGSVSPLEDTAGNFLRALAPALLLQLVFSTRVSPEPEGLLLAVLSGALASGVGYAVWYSALPLLRKSSAATVQLAVPVLAALGGVVLLGEAVSLRLGFAAAAVLGGVAAALRAPADGAPNGS